MKKNKGMTLVELMIVISIIGILGAVAYPAMTSYLKAGERADGVSALLELAQKMEKYYLVNDSYASASITTLMGSAKSKEEKYDLAFEGTPDAYGYVLKATPVDTDPECGSLTLSSIGEKDTSTSSADLCW